MKINKRFLIFSLLLIIIVFGFNSVSASDSSDLLEDSSSDLSLSTNHESELILDSDSGNSIDDEILDSSSDGLDELDSSSNEIYNSNLLNDDIDSIYVSKTGADDNDGSESAPVASISKAVDLAKDKSSRIIIKEGIYNENNIIVNTTKEAYSIS